MFRLLYATLSRKEHTYIEFMQIKNTLKEMEYLNTRRRKSPLESQFRAHVITLYTKMQRLHRAINAKISFLMLPLPLHFYAFILSCLFAYKIYLKLHKSLY